MSPPLFCCSLSGVQNFLHDSFLIQLGLSFPERFNFPFQVHVPLKVSTFFLFAILFLRLLLLGSLVKNDSAGVVLPFLGFDLPNQRANKNATVAFLSKASPCLMCVTAKRKGRRRLRKDLPDVCVHPLWNSRMSSCINVAHTARKRPHCE